MRFTRIDSLEGDCIFISPCNRKSFRSCHYSGGEGDLAYNMKDGTVAPFAADIPEDKVQTADGKLIGLSTWLFPPE